MVLTGIFPALTTPFYPDGRIYPKKLEHNVDRYSRTPVSGMTILGSTGEVVMLSESEQREVLQVAVEAAAPEKVLLAGVGHESALKTVEAAEYAAKLNYDIALVRTPHYYRPQMKRENLLAYYRFVADRSPLPVMLYSVPPFTARLYWSTRSPSRPWPWRRPRRTTASRDARASPPDRSFHGRTCRCSRRC